MTKDEMNTLIDENLDQPIEGLLYNLDLMPEQCKSDTNNLRRLVIEKLHKMAMEKK